MIKMSEDYSKVGKVQWSDEIGDKFGRCMAHFQPVEFTDLEDGVNKCRQILEQHMEHLKGKDVKIMLLQLGGSYTL